MKIHRAASLGFSIQTTEGTDASPPGADDQREFPWRDAQWATLKRGDELVFVRAIGAQADGSFIGEVFALDPDAAVERDGIRLGDQVAFQAAHVFAYESASHRSASGSGPQDQAEERVRQSDHIKAAFIATLSHDAREPLAPLVGTIRFLQAKAPPDLKFAVDLLERQSAQIRRVVKDLLDLSRIQSGTWSIKKRRVDLAWVLHTAIEEVRHLFDEKRQQFADSYPQQRIELEADSARLAEAVANLLSNASQYTPAGGRIGLCIERKADEVLIRVTDSGVGIPETLRERMFDPFVRGESASERREGLGIGLTLVKGVVDLHEGHIEVKSEGPGKGSEFLVRLPNRKPAVRT